MSVRYVAVQWTRTKVIYDLLLVALVALYLQAFPWFSQTVGSGPALDPRIVPMRAYGSCAFLLLTLILLIGPLARLDTRFLPLLYNRRHLGVAMFVVALGHVYYVLGYYFAYGRFGSVEALSQFDTSWTSRSWPFITFGAAALTVFAWMAATSHDFWQHTLGPRLWKSTHMLVYPAYALVVLHVVFGALQFERHPLLLLAVGLSILGVGMLHLLAARVSKAGEKAHPKWVEAEGTRWLDAGRPEDIPEKRALPLLVPGQERIAVVRYDGKVSALHGVCRHQQGPLYEGKVIDGALTCPWHGWAYRPCDGKAPPPFTEKLPTYAIKLSDEGRILVDPRPLPAGTKTAPAVFDREVAEASGGARTGTRDERDESAP